MSTAVNHDIRGQSLVRGVIRGSIPVKGRFMDGESVMEIDRSRTRLQCRRICLTERDLTPSSPKNHSVIRCVPSHPGNEAFADAGSVRREIAHKRIVNERFVEEFVVIAA